MRTYKYINIINIHRYQSQHVLLEMSFLCHERKDMFVNVLRFFFVDVNNVIFSVSLQLRSALDRIDELEVSNSHLSKRLEKMKANRNALLAQQ